MNDAPVGDGASDDLLEVTDVANSLAGLITASRATAPFTVAVDAAWGMGKSSLMHQLEARLSAEPDTAVVWFNAWTSGPTSALEGLIKSVLLRFDRNLIRRAVRSMSRRAHLFGVLRSMGLVVASFFGLGGVVDQIWQRLSLDARARNEIKGVLRDAIGGWMEKGGTPDRRRLVVVFVDDLDRCASARVIEVCEAIKLYLDVPGMVFVLACHQSALQQAVRESGGVGAQVSAGEYLEKIVQISYRIPVPSKDQTMRLVNGYLELSNTSGLLDESMKSMVIDRTSRNPRRIKRLINSFVLEYHLSRSWDEFGVENLVKVIMLQHFYPDFYRLIASPKYRDPIRDFLIYHEFRAAVKQGSEETLDRWEELFETTEVRLSQTTEALTGLESELPSEFRELAADRDFVALLGGIDVPSEGLVEHLRRRPLSTVDTSAVALTDPAALERLLALPSVHVVVDGHHMTEASSPALPLAEQRERVIHQLAALAAQTSAEVTVVLDSAGLITLPRTPRGVRVLLPEPGKPVDEVIEALVVAEPDGRPVVVVTSARAVIDSVRRHGVHPIPPAVLLSFVERL
ncbi:NYN domain-containing protein [Amycolatopsis sp. NPDC051071]|uniref:NYN domain-containing protein n=1 Tax=Amycolatopsis sp. NPDC051071 TaxID=3154637 RepID=UPI0034285202